MSHPSFFIILVLCSCYLWPALAQPPSSSKSSVPEVEWYPIENEKSRSIGQTRVILSGKTAVGSSIQIDGDSVTLLKAIGLSPRQNIESVERKTNAEGFFELPIELPYGLIQLPVTVTTPQKSEKTFLLTFEVNAVRDQIAVDTKTSNRKPPAAAKKVRLWTGAGWTYQGYTKSTSGAANLKFQTIQAPGVMARGGYWGDSWGVDFYFRDAPGKIEADAPFLVESDQYHWRTGEVKGLYQLDRNANSRLFGLASQWQIRFGGQYHEVPFLEIQSNNRIQIEKNTLTTATLGVGLLLGQEQRWTYEFALGAQYPISVQGPGESFQASQSVGYEMQLGAAYKFAPQWRIGVFSYTQSLSYSYQYQKTGSTVVSEGQQSIFSTTFDLRLGYEF